ncbi:MAG: hypothetical protein LBE35_01860 [Clostridiales bacterium]|jgi:hypothetical protein|nr:hypothetical protein [Clostridiales bacterium]
MKKFWCILIFAAALILAACGRAEPAELSDLEYALKAAYERRLEIIKPDYNMLISLTEGRRPLTWEQLYEYGYLSTLWEWESDWEILMDMPEAISVEDALMDARELFIALRHVYGGYLYFGGDEVFVPLLEAVLADISAHGDRIATMDLINILHGRLSEVIVDNHFSVWNRFMSQSANFYYSRALIFDRTENGFRNRESGLYVSEVRGHEVDEVFRLSIDDEGNLFYSPIVMTLNMPSVYPLVITYEDGTATTTALFQRSHDHREFAPANMEFIEGIPVISVMRMGFTAHDNSSSVECARAFLSFAEQVRDEPVIIVDLRGNGGGNGNLGARWFYSLLGEVIPANRVWVTAREFDGWVENHPENQFHDRREDIEHLVDSRGFEGHTVGSTHADRIVANEQLIIILVDRGTASAAEGMADLALNMENTLIIGQNTGGALGFDLTYFGLSLPNSEIPLGFGRTMMVWPEGHFAEGVGLAPDIWAQGDALAAALQLIINN